MTLIKGLVFCANIYKQKQISYEKEPSATKRITTYCIEFNGDLVIHGTVLDNIGYPNVNGGCVFTGPYACDNSVRGCGSYCDRIILE